MLTCSIFFKKVLKLFFNQHFQESIFDLLPWIDLIALFWIFLIFSHSINVGHKDFIPFDYFLSNKAPLQLSYLFNNGLWHNVSRNNILILRSNTQIMVKWRFSMTLRIMEVLWKRWKSTQDCRIHLPNVSNQNSRLSCLKLNFQKRKNYIFRNKTFTDFHI